MWYKMLDFSALYFVYVLAERMALNSQVYDDKDTYIKANFVASVQDIETVAEEFLRLGGKSVDITTTGIYILTLAEPKTMDDYTNLVKLEMERRDKLHNIFRPAGMAPATYKLLLDVVKLFGPKLEHLEKRYFFAVGENIMRDLSAVFRVYFSYSDGLIGKNETGERLLQYLNSIKAGLGVLAEVNAWNSLPTATVMGEALMLLREQVVRDFKIKVGSQKNVKSGSEQAG